MEKRKIDINVYNSFLNGDEKAFSILFHSYSEEILRRIYYIVKNQDLSVDLMQQLFVKLWHKRQELSITLENFESYLYKMAVSVSLDQLRKNVRDQNLINSLKEYVPRSDESAEDVYVYKESLSILEEAIDLLPQQRKQIFTLCRLEGKSYQEVSLQLGISVSTVSNQLVSATKSIRSYASKYHLEIKFITLILFF